MLYIKQLFIIILYDLYKIVMNHMYNKTSFGHRILKILYKLFYHLLLIYLIP
jgi:hypothetical protein